MSPTATEMHGRLLDRYIQMALDGRAAAVTWIVETFGDDSGPSDVVGYAGRIAGDPDVYQALSLVESEAPTLSFVPITLGERPPDGAKVLFGGEKFTLFKLFPLSPGGVDISHRCIVVR